MTGAQTKDYSRGGVGGQRGPQQGRKDNFVCISTCVGLVLNFPRVERVLVRNGSISVKFNRVLTRL